MSRVFRYNLALLQKKSRIRITILASVLLAFLLANSFPLPAQERTSYLSFFGPLILIFLFFLYWMQKKQMSHLAHARIEIENGMLRQWDASSYCSEWRINEITKIVLGKFQSYDRLVLETETKFLPLVNLENVHALAEFLSKETGLPIEKDLEEESQIFSPRSLFFLLPSLVFSFLVYWKNGESPFSLPILALLWNGNLLVLFLYWKEKTQYLPGGFSLKRRMIGIGLLTFLFQVYIRLSDAGYF